MDISAASFRDTIIKSFGISYDWETEMHVADIRVRSDDGLIHAYRIETGWPHAIRTCWYLTVGSCDSGRERTG
jgi:hypothetical protein